MTQLTKMKQLIYRLQTHQQRKPLVFAAFVVFIGVGFSTAAWWVTSQSAEQTAKTRLESISDQAVSVLHRRMVANEQILRGARALFDSHGGWVSREQWRAYVAGLKLDDNFPGIQGVGFSLRFSAAELKAHTERIRREGYPAYAVRPDWDRPEYTSIIYLEPFWGRNLRAFGFDMTTETVRRDALERARDSGEASLSSRVTLVQETNQDVQPGFLLYIPVYRANKPVNTVQERRDALLGYVYSPYRSRDLLSSLFATSAEEVGIEIFAGREANPENLLYSNMPSGEKNPARYRTRRHIKINGTDWSMQFSGTPAFESIARPVLPLMILLGGSLASLVFAYGSLVLSRTRDQATQIAQEMTNQFIRSEGRLHAVLDSAADGILTVDVRGRIETLNRSAEHIFGISTAVIAGHPLTDLIEELDIARIWALLEHRGSTKGVNRSARLDALGKRATGDAFPVSVSLSEMEVDNELRFSLIVRDVTDAKYAESILRLRERVIESSSNGIVIVVATLKGLPVMYVNPAFEQITGYSSSEAIGRNCSFLQGEDRDQPGLDELREAIAKRQPATVLLRNYRKRGDLFWNELTISPVFDEQGEVTHFVGIQNDVTDRMIALETLERRTHRLNAVFTLSPDGFVAVDGRGRVSDVNPAFLHMTGLESEQVINAPIEELDHLLQDRCDPTQPYASLLVPEEHGDIVLPPGQERRAGVRHTLKLAQPRERILQWSLQSERSKDGDRVVYFRDVTRETEIDRLKSEFLSTAAHELRTPLASIFGFSELLVKRKYDEERRQDMVGTINRQAGILIRLVNELLDLARIEARAGKDFRFTHQALAPIIHNTLNGLMVGADERRVLVNIPDYEINVKVDAEKLSQAISNVLTNAYKYSPNGGPIELDVIEECSHETERVGVRVTDHGIGMSAEHLGRLFERFFRADPSGNIPGTGLGMCIVKEIMELHGGNVEVQSELGRGTTITLWVPAVAQCMKAA